jgi:hypothetical protein
VAILLMVIVVILLMAIGDNFMNGCCGDSINGYWWILLFIINYYINGY